MPYADLHKAVQTSGKMRISTKWLREKAIEFSHIVKIKEQWSGIVEAASLRAWYIEGPLGPPVPLKENEALIVLSRQICLGSQGDYWRRLILTKELMHVFDAPDEKAGDRESFDKQIQRLKDPNAEMTPQYRAELKAYWRALAALCPETKRLEYKGQLAKDQISWEVVAASLSLPVAAIRWMMGDNYESNIKASM